MVEWPGGGKVQSSLNGFEEREFSQSKSGMGWRRVGPFSLVLERPGGGQVQSSLNGRRESSVNLILEWFRGVQL